MPVRYATKKQGFAIFLATGYDIRQVNMKYEDAAEIMARKDVAFTEMKMEELASKRKVKITRKETGKGFTTPKKLRQRITVTVPPSPEEVDARFRQDLMEYMSHTGKKRKLVPNDIWEKAYLACDGFGSVDKAFAISQCWDWSHVRDSSPEAVRRAWNIIAQYESDLVANSIDQ